MPFQNQGHLCLSGMEFLTYSFFTLNIYTSLHFFQFLDLKLGNGVSALLSSWVVLSLYRMSALISFYC